MRLSAQALLSLATSLACFGAVVDAGGVLEVDLVFPRNETYAPGADMPVVFAFQNGDAEFVRYLEPAIDYFVWNLSDGNTVNSSFGEHRWAKTNWSNHKPGEPYFLHDFHGLFKPGMEGRWRLSWQVSWAICGEEEDDPEPVWRSNSYIQSVEYTINSKDGRAWDLVAATADDITCTTAFGVTINATDVVREVPKRKTVDGGTCAVVYHSSPTPNPCQIEVSSAAAASISASWTASLCSPWGKLTMPQDTPANCPSENGDVQRLAIAGVASLAVALGAIGFLLP
ncbi:hypothetical protein N657DRAFT_646842 [Parathielavia appendiculata]|uniref:DUF7136 domain-containing protein n=1 Tax=Parathielavia appendiculata TaxID=2587402 RepID=A0AAN6Z1J5_9PEZI|nr:hypothetical protein N657DRAFT_646842 [Parathielavia appendiculata]